MNAFKHFVLDEWDFAVPMFLMSLAAMALVVWRFLLNLNAKTDMDEFLQDFQEVLRKDGVEGAIALCEDENGMIPRKLYTAGLEASKQGVAAMKRAMASAMELEIIPSLN